MVLVDTSVWIEHLRKGVPELVDLLESGLVRVHPFVVGEIACGNLRNRREVLASMGGLPAAIRVSDREALELIELRALMGRGIGYLDVHLLASALLDPPTRLWTRDRPLDQVAAELRVSYAAS